MEADNLSRNEFVYRSRLSLAVNREEEAIKLVRKLISQFTPPDLAAEERIVVLVAFYSKLCELRCSWVKLRKIESRLKDNEKDRKRTIHEYRSKIVSEMREFCGSIFNLIDKKLLRSDSSDEARAFYTKLKADLNGFLCEFLPSSKLEKIKTKAKCYYNDAQEIAKSLHPQHPTRLEVSLNYSSFYKDVFKNWDSAYYHAIQAVEAAGHGALLEEPSPEATLIVAELNNLLRGLECKQEENEKKEGEEEKWLPKFRGNHILLDKSLLLL
ncbi:hypothetical protein LguiA_024415 [Lonicera macranthoides]